MGSVVRVGHRKYRRGSFHWTHNMRANDADFEDIKYLTEKARVMIANWVNPAGPTPSIPMNVRAMRMCMICGHTSTMSAHRDLVTGTCKNERQCAKRRRELDNETIEFLGLIPRERTDSG